MRVDYHTQIELEGFSSIFNRSILNRLCFESCGVGVVGWVASSATVLVLLSYVSRLAKSPVVLRESCSGIWILGSFDFIFDKKPT